MATANLPPDIPNEPVWRLTVKQYHSLIEAGAFTDDDPIELLEGWLVPKMPKNPPHSVSFELSRNCLGDVLTPGCHLRIQEPLTTAESEPEPDGAVVEGSVRRYALRHPEPQEVKMVMEISDTTLNRDRKLKKRIYARAKIPVYWIVNLVDRKIEVYTDPTGPTESPDYRRRQVFGERQKVPVVLDGKEIARLPVKTFLP